MEEKFAAALEDLGLVGYRERLSKLGVEKRSDLIYLKDEDLREVGFTIVQIRKLQYLATSATKGEDLTLVPASPVPASPKEDKSKLKKQTTFKLSIDEESPRPRDDDAQEEHKAGQEVGQKSEKAADDAACKQPENPSSVSALDLTRLSAPAHKVERPPRIQRSKTAGPRTSEFWLQQLRRPMRLIFVRHGESEANADRKITATVPDHMLHLTESGRQQALDAGLRLKGLLGEESVKFTVSPYVRTRETLNGILRAWGSAGMEMPIREDVRIREQEYGNFDDPDMPTLHKEKKKFGAFYYRFPSGESPADCYDRASLFLESMYRAWNDNHSQNQVVVCHGMMILVTLMRLLRLPIEEFDSLDSLKNCEFVVLERPQEDAKFNIAFTWAAGQPRDYRGLRSKPKSERPQLNIWDGNPEAPAVSSRPVRKEAES